MSLKIHNQLTEEDRINYFHSLIKGDVLKTFKSINGPTREILGENPALFRSENVKPQSMATAKQNFQKLVFNPANQKLVDFLDEFQRLARRHIPNCRPRHHWTIHIRQNATTPEEINKLGPLGGWHIRTDCNILSKWIRNKWSASPWWATDKHCEPQCSKHKRGQTQTNVPPLRKTRTLQKSVPSAEKAKRAVWRNSKKS